jgi:hypothetical protein
MREPNRGEGGTEKEERSLKIARLCGPNPIASFDPPTGPRHLRFLFPSGPGGGTCRP